MSLKSIFKHFIFYDLNLLEQQEARYGGFVVFKVNQLKLLIIINSSIFFSIKRRIRRNSLSIALINFGHKIRNMQKIILETFYFLHQIDPMKRERATAVFMDFCHTKLGFWGKMYWALPCGNLRFVLWPKNPISSYYGQNYEMQNCQDDTNSTVHGRRGFTKTSVQITLLITVPWAQLVFPSATPCNE